MRHAGHPVTRWGVRPDCRKYQGVVIAEETEGQVYELVVKALGSRVEATLWSELADSSLLALASSA
jgi:hypothetical protein